MVIEFIIEIIILYIGLNVIFTSNPVNAVLYLIIVCILSSLLLLLLKVSFLALSFLLIYVGAITVLFLFVIMMLNLNIIKRYEHLSTLILSFFLFILFYYLLFNIKNYFFINFHLKVYIKLLFSFLFLLQLINKSYYLIIIEPQWTWSISKLITDNYLINDYIGVTLLQQLAKLIYIKYGMIFLSCGLILIISLIGSVDLILQLKKRESYLFSFDHKYQKLFEQINRTIDQSILFVH